ncbi:hypothetical protein SVIOM74S_05240 [Streptomyces violarus]
MATTADRTAGRAAALHDLLPPVTRRRTRIGLVAGGLGTYWPQFPGLLPQLKESAAYVAERFRGMDAEVTDAGFVSDAQEGARAAEQLRKADCDLIVLFLTTYLTSSMVLPIAQRTHTPVLVIDLQPSEKMDHASFDTGAWLAYCGQCPVPVVALQPVIEPAPRASATRCSRAPRPSASCWYWPRPPATARNRPDA